MKRSDETTDHLERKRAILDYWTLVEFFSPYLLDNILGDKQNIQRVYVDQPCDFPWSVEMPLAEDDPGSAFVKGYHLYLGIFSTEETADRARHVFVEKPNDWHSVDWRQCGSVSTHSCFARLTVTKFGTPILGSLTLSTLPWAHGRLLNNQSTFLTMESYWKGVQRLLLDLDENYFDSLIRRVVRLPKETAGVLDHATLSKLVEFLFEWAGYVPRGYPIALIEPLNIEENRAAKDPKIESVREIPILNSFYIQDLEKAAESLNSQKNNLLHNYLNGKNHERIELQSKEGESDILAFLKPSKHPKGRWPASTTNQQALMQQFAINQVVNSLGEESFFSINGPPGTGKTTLLREIIADNIVARATALAKFEKAKDVFVGNRAVGFGDGDPVFVKEIHSSLLGFEMVVVSSNNTAVQNLSHELPLRQQVDPSYVSISYLETVVQKLLGLKEMEAWGLVSGALGNVENCRQLVERIFINRDKTGEGGRIWEWAKEYKGPSFSEARSNFLALQEEHSALLSELDCFVELHEELLGGNLEAYFNRSLEVFVSAEEKAAALEAQQTQFQDDEKEVQLLFNLLERQVKLWNKERPNVFHRLSKSKSWSEWAEQSNEYNKKQIAALEEIRTHKNSIQKIRKKLEKHYATIALKELEVLEWSFCLEVCQEKYEKYKQTYPNIGLPKGSLEDPEVQKMGYYQNEKLNHCRSNLFVAAMALHEAWLAETLLPKGGFRGNLMAISNLLQGKSPTTTNDTRLVWQCVFLLIPLLSSTFASIGRLFRYIEPQTLGWVFIDEAGQALPQAAVGAIWRAKKVLSIGDPFQIEPISSVPPEIVDGMAKFLLKDHYLTWAPSQVSVQNLMDAASKYGTKRYVREVPHWLGVPLRVHRRCVEPMFSIANEIAYENNMVLATSEKPCSLPKSCWYDIAGAVADRQYVPVQGVELVKRLNEILTIMNTPDVYVISPFREVVKQVQNLIIRDTDLKKIFQNKFSKVALKAWAREAVGTVHSFQGKEANAVFFVLGADGSTLGSIEWASRKPNLLNVAVSRARQRFYIIGDYNLWHRWPYFDVAAKKLERVLYRL